MRAFIALLILLATPALAAPPLLTVVELFTSQGCSSCPPADALLTELQRNDPNLLALDMHVTYWDRLGWKDPFSLPAVTQRQRGYSSRMGLDSVYTPQMVVGGRFEAIGSDAAAVQQAITRARASVATTPLSLSLTASGVHIHVPAGANHGTLVMAGFDRQHTTPVRAGENGGRTLTEVNVVRSLSELGPWSGAAYDADVPRPDGERVAVLLQADDGRIMAAAASP
jgi:hypothetical protein